ncbi:hypothetical protein LIER_43969 [Lithospermum erythrorhizon]|uniref:Uncharacterized protein n=1 Tax=Lithospermum erythrorhizon TaxID=34254 RepID=A0AAV3RGD9_LITER
MGGREGAGHYPGPHQKKSSVPEEEHWLGRWPLDAEASLMEDVIAGPRIDQIFLRKFATTSMDVSSHRLSLRGTERRGRSPRSQGGSLKRPRRPASNQGIKRGGDLRGRRGTLNFRARVRRVRHNVGNG